MRIIASGDTHIGQVRSSNQDSICLAPEHRLFAVADGMGGHNGGDIASQMSVKILPEFFNENSSTMEPTDLLANSIKHVNESIYEHGQKNKELKGMGTTIVSILVEKDKVFLGNIGDSRAYMIKKNRLFQLTKDHSLVQEKLNLGIYTREKAKNDPQKNVLVKTVGFEPNVEPDIYQYKFAANDLFLLCSDGLHGKVSDPDILFVVNKYLQANEPTQEILDQITQELIDQANANGGQDNISVILVSVA